MEEVGCGCYTNSMYFLVICKKKKISWAIHLFVSIDDIVFINYYLNIKVWQYKKIVKNGKKVTVNKMNNIFRSNIIKFIYLKTK